MKNNLQWLSMLILILFSSNLLYAQINVTGTVYDADLGETLPGVNVIVTGTDRGVVTNLDGQYEITVPNTNSSLTFSYVGMNPQTIFVGDQRNINVRMASGIELDDIVVTALGIKREKKTLGYATQEVGGDEVTKVKDANFVNALSGKIAGVDIKKSSGIGGSSNVIIRGYTSLSGNNQALFVVDGIPLSNFISNTENQKTGRGGYDFGNAAMDINPEDIESINVLKGAAATALYGSDGANGVVLITTKKGAKKADGDNSIGVSFSAGYTIGNVDLSTTPKYQKEYGPGYSTLQGWYASDGVEGDPAGFDYFDFGDGENLAAAVYEDASYGPRFDSGLQVYDWRSFYPELADSYGKTFPYVAGENDANSFYETSNAFNTNIAFDGGTEIASYRLSYTYFDQDGLLPNSNVKRNSISLGGGYDLSERLKVSSSINYVLTDGIGRYGTGYDNRNVNQSFRQWYSANIDVDQQRQAYEQTGLNISWNPYATLNPGIATQPHYFDNYYFNVYENYPTDNRNRIFGNIALDYEMNDVFSLTGRIGTDRYTELQEERIAVGSVDVPKYERYDRNFKENNLDLFLNAEDYLGAGDVWSVGAMIGTNIKRRQVEAVRAETNGGLIVPELYALTNSANPIGQNDVTENFTRYGKNGYFGRLNFGYDRLVFLDLTGRYDISSTLPVENRAYFYPSASLSFIFSELTNSNQFDFGKLRLNYAEVGNDPDPLKINPYYVLNSTFASIATASVPSIKNNPNLLPERTRSLEAGVELRFFRDRVGLDAAVYQANSFNQIYDVRVSGATGELENVLNAGEIQNSGIELALNFTPVKTNDFRWDMNLNWGKNVNEVLDLYDDQTNLQIASPQGGITINATVGEPYGAIWGTNYQYDSNGNPIVYPHWNGGVRYRKTGTPEVIGNIQPDWKGGVQNSLNFKGIDLGFLIDFQKGGDFFSLDSWYGTATGIYENSAGTNSQGGEVRALPEDGGGIFLDDDAVVHATDANGDFMYDEDGNPIGGDANNEAYYAADVYTSLGYVYAPNAYHVYDASFVKLREVSLGFGLPDRLTKTLPFSNLSFAVTGRNLWIIHKNSPYSDPEAGLSAGNVQGNQSGAFPSVREIGINLKANF